MDNNEEIYEIDRKIYSNSDNIDILHRKLIDLQEEETYSQSEIFGRAKAIDNMSNVLQGDIVIKLQEKAFSFLEESKIRIEKAFMSEREELENTLKSLELENEELIWQKHKLQEEG